MNKLIRRLYGGQSASFHQRDTRAEKECLAQIVGHEYDGLPQAILESEKFSLQFNAGDGVERAERLVHQENWRIGGKSAGDAHPLPLTS